MSDTRVCVGAIGGAFGVRGEVRLKSFTADPSDIAAYGPVETEDGIRHFDITLGRPIKGAIAARLSGVTSKEEADALRGLRLYVPRDRLPEPEDDEYYHADLIGIDVYDTGGGLLGRVKSVQSNGADDLLEIHGAGLKQTVLLPFTRAAVPTVDISARRIVADPPAGLWPE